jgi:drug/metabolite transporter (DMT)-like permease
MTLTVCLAVLGAALLHASWNALIKSGADKQTGIFILSVGHALIGLCIIPFHGLPPGAVWPWLLASCLIHLVYHLFLSYAYAEGDLSRVYPIARGAAPMMVLAVTAAFGIDAISGWEIAGLAVLGCGIVLMARGVFSSGESRRMLPYAIGSAVATAAYTLVDGLGARVWGDPLGFVGWLMVGSAVFYTPAIVAVRGRAVLRASGRVWAIGLVAAAASFAAYGIVIWAMTVAPIALVAALRETAILFAVVLGWIAFGDRISWQKGGAAALIVAGVMVTRI